MITLVPKDCRLNSVLPHVPAHIHPSLTPDARVQPRFSLKQAEHPVENASRQHHSSLAHQRIHPQTAQAGSAHRSLINSIGVHQTKTTGSENTETAAQPLKEILWLPGRALLPWALRGRLVHKQLSRSGWHRQSHPASTEHLPAKGRAHAWPASFPRATQPTGPCICPLELGFLLLLPRDTCWGRAQGYKEG